MGRVCNCPHVGEAQPPRRGRYNDERHRIIRKSQWDSGQTWRRHNDIKSEKWRWWETAEKMPFDLCIILYSVNCFRMELIILHGAFGPNGHLFCEYPSGWKIWNFDLFRAPISSFEVVTYMSKLRGLIGGPNANFLRALTDSCYAIGGSYAPGPLDMSSLCMA